MTGHRAHQPLPPLPLPLPVSTTNPSRRLLPLAALLTALAVLAAPAAQADTWRHDDAVHDVLVTDYDGGPATVDPEETLVDVKRLTVDVTTDRVQVALSFSYAADGDTTFKIATSQGDTVHVLYANGGRPFFFRNSYQSTCAGVSVDRTRYGLVLRVPQRCLGSVYRVRAGAQISADVRRDEPGGALQRSAADDAFRTGKYTSRSPKLGPWVAASRAS